MAKPKQYKFSAIDNATIQDGYTTLVIANGLATVTTPEQVSLAERNGGRLVVANVVERKKPAAKKKES